ncbi:class I SAM-dependent methyltransferase [Halosegnis sp.]|uniref:class I SAM-dependent methyltransferase n=1 Tax=Halosegnis sp. TaxID=2864959 RepID=UPI0035D43FB2
MGFHTFDADRAATLDDPARFEHCSVEELFGLLPPDTAATVADLGSGTGLYTERLAQAYSRVYGVDVQAAMHDYYRERGIATNVDLVRADIVDLPFSDGELDGAVSTFTFHEFADVSALAECRRTLRAGASLALVDWSAAGPGEAGPPTAERYDAAAAADLLAEAGFVVETACERCETFAALARTPQN